MPTPKRTYETPVLRSEDFNLGVFGDYGLDTGSLMPVQPDEDGRPRLNFD